MARLLFRLGQHASQRAARYILGWVAILAVAAGSFLAFGGTLATSFDIPGTETSRVTEEIAAELGGGDGANGTAVFSAQDGALTDAQRQEISTLLTEVAEVEGVSAVVDPFVTETERAALAEQLAAGQAQLEALPADQQLANGGAQIDAGARLLDAAAGLRTVSEDGSTALGTIVFEASALDLTTEVKEGVAQVLDGAAIDGVAVDYSSVIAQSVDGLLGPGEIIGVVVALLVLIILFRSLVPALTPLLSSIVGVGVGVAGAMALSGSVEMSSVTPVLGVMLGLAVGIDYSLFIMNRHRRQVLAGMDVRESIGLANGTAGNAVVFAGATVVIALIALNVTGVGFLGVMGSVGAFCVLIAVLVSVSLTPALLGLLGTRIVGRRARATIGHDHHTEATPTPMRTSRAVVGGVVGILGLLLIAVPAMDMRLGLPDGSTEAQDTTQYRSYATIEREFGAGANGTIVVTTALPEAATQESLTIVQADLAERLMEQDGVAAVAPAGVSEDMDFLLFQVVPTGGPSSVETENLVHDLREASPLTVGDGEVTLGVAGAASGNIDISEKLADALPVYLLVVVGLSLIILIVVFRSLLVPLIATAGYVLSLVAAFGAIVAVYQWGWLGGIFGVEQPGPVLSFAPIIIMGVLFGLAMDYQLFLVSGMREAYVHGMPARAAVVAGRRSGRVVVTAAAIIMVSVFGGFVFSHMAMVRPIGFGLAIGVLFDAFVVRMLIVPALMHLFGDKAWWLPRWLDRLLPDVDVEGAALERSHPGVGGGGAAAGDAGADAAELASSR